MTQETEINRGRTVAIIGRPNTGKSSIFNRLSGKRIALVHEETGVTRDRIISEAQWEGEKFELIDTAGIEFDLPGEPDSLADIKQGMIKQAKIAVQDAAAIILVVDTQTGITPQDEFIVDLIRKHGRTPFVAANKADNTEKDAHAVEFERFGFPVFPVSALHYRGFEPLMRSVLKTLPPTEDTETADRVKVAVVGRPNVGKSSFINRLLRSERLIVSSTPGTTRDSVETPFSIGSGPSARHYLLTDTAGIRKRNKIPSTVDRLGLVKVERSIKEADVVLMLIDATQGPTALDKRIAAMVLENKKGCVLVINKWDLMSEYTQRHYITELRNTLPFLEFVPLVFVSAASGFNVRRAIDAVDDVAAQIQTNIPTGVLNRAIIKAYSDVQPKMVKGKRLKIFYATQTETKPITITLFVNNTDKLTPAYRTYLIKQIRHSFGLEGAPLVLKTKGKSETSKKTKPSKRALSETGQQRNYSPPARSAVKKRKATGKKSRTRRSSK